MNRCGKILVLLAIALCVLCWRALPLAGIFNGGNLRVSGDFTTLDGMVPPRKAPTAAHEGLAHPSWDGVRLCFEVLFKPRRIIHGHAFAFGTARNGMVGEIASVLTDRASYLPWTGEKNRGGFHANRYFRWTDGSRSWEVLVGEGCGEALLFHEGRSLRCDLSPEAVRVIMELEK
jgi:hypothetical protein